MVQSKKDSPEKLATQDEDKQNNDTTHVPDTTSRKQTQTTLTRHVPSYKQLEPKINRTSVFVIQRRYLISGAEHFYRLLPLGAIFFSAPPLT
jgi:hypothetical protein